MPDTTHYAIGAMQVRSIDKEARRATFVAATETPVATWRGMQYLDVTGVQLDRYVGNNVLLDSHDRSTIESIVGNATMKIEGRKLIAETTYADTPRGHIAWALVSGGHVRAVSVGFIAEQIRSIVEGETYQLGDVEIRGPAEVVTSWPLLELSLVPVPADPNALARAQLDTLSDEALRSVIERVMNNIATNTGVTTMPDEKKEEHNPALEELTRENLVLKAEQERIQIVTSTLRMRAPTALPKATVDRIVLESRSIDDGSRAFAAALEAESKPLGTTEPARREDAGPTVNFRDISTNEFMSGLRAL